MMRLPARAFFVPLVLLLASGVPSADDVGEKTPERGNYGSFVTLPEELPRNREVLDKLEETKVSFTFNEQPVGLALDYLQTLGKVNIVLDVSKLEDADATTTLKLSDVPLSIALKLVVTQMNLKYVVRYGIVFISDEEGVKQHPVTAVYNVDGLLDLLSAGMRSDRTKLLNELVESIEATVEPGAWDEGSGYAIRGLAGMLVITHRPEVHRKVRELLDKLTRAKAGPPRIRTGRSPGPRHKVRELLDKLTRAKGRPSRIRTWRRARSRDVERPAGAVVLKRYDVTDLVRSADAKKDTPLDAAARVRLARIRELIRAVIEPDTWHRVPGCTLVSAATGTLAVSHTPATHERVEKLLNGLRSMKTGGAKPTRRTLWNPGIRERGYLGRDDIRRRLGQRRCFHFWGRRRR